MLGARNSIFFLCKNCLPFVFPDYWQSRKIKRFCDTLNYNHHHHPVAAVADDFDVSAVFDVASVGVVFVFTAVLIVVVAFVVDDIFNVGVVYDVGDVFDVLTSPMKKK